MDWNHLNNFERGPTKDHSCEVWSKSNQWFRRRCCLKIVDGRTYGRRRRRRTVSDHKSSPWAFSSGELKMYPKINPWKWKFESVGYDRATTESAPDKWRCPRNATIMKHSSLEAPKEGEVRSKYWLCWGLTTRQPLRVILCRLSEKWRKEIEEIVEEMKERDREERGTGMKVKKQKK